MNRELKLAKDAIDWWTRQAGLHQGEVWRLRNENLELRQEVAKWKGLAAAPNPYTNDEVRQDG